MHRDTRSETAKGQSACGRGHTGKLPRHGHTPVVLSSLLTSRILAERQRGSCCGTSSSGWRSLRREIESRWSRSPTRYGIPSLRRREVCRTCGMPRSGNASDRHWTRPTGTLRARRACSAQSAPACTNACARSDSRGGRSLPHRSRAPRDLGSGGRERAVRRGRSPRQPDVAPFSLAIFCSALSSGARASRVSDQRNHQCRPQGSNR